MTSSSSSGGSLSNSESNLIKPNKHPTGEEPIKNFRQNFILVIVSIALLLDGMLNMAILPLVPEFLKYLTEYSEAADKLMSFFKLNNNSTNTSFIDPNDTSTKFNYNRNDVAIGFLFAMKPFVQLIVNPFSGSLIDHIGYDLPMMGGLLLQFGSTLIFTFTTSFGSLFLARALQGVGSAFATTSGFSMIAFFFKEQVERSRALGIVITSLALGSFMSVPFSGFLFEYAGKRVPFIMLAVLALIDSFLLLINWRSKCTRVMPTVQIYEKPKKTPIWTLLADPYIAICSMSLIMANVPLAFTEPTIAIWMKSTMNSSESQIGFIWLSGFLPHITGVYITVWFVKKYPQHQWLFLVFGLTIEAFACLSIPFIKNYFVLMIPICFICFGYGLIDATVLPTVAYLVDTRHASVYGSVYAIVDISYSLCYAFGPMIAGIILHFLGFQVLTIITCSLILLFLPFLYFLRSIYIAKTNKDKQETTESTDRNSDIVSISNSVYDPSIIQ